MKVKNQNLNILDNKFFGKTNNAFNKSLINKFPKEIEISRVITYNEILGELIDLEYYDLYEEFEDRLYLGECPNIILLSIITRNKENKSILGYLLNPINYFIDKDIMKLFD